MRDARFVLLISTGGNSIFRETTRDRYSLPPLGIMSIAAVLQAHGYEVRIIDLATENFSASRFAAEMRGLGRVPVLVGLSVWTETFPASVELARLLKRIFPETAVVMGGPHVTFMWEEALACPAVDFVVRGEGESTMIEILETTLHGLPRSAVRGIAYRDEGGDVRCTPDRPPIVQLDHLPIPPYSSVEGRYRPDVLTMVTSRGCPGQCVFCASRAFSGGVYRVHSAEWVVSVIYFCRQQFPFDVFSPLDDTFTASLARTQRVCELLRQCGLRLVWAIKSRVDYITEASARMLAEAGCMSVHLGMESGDDNVLKAIGKHITLRQIRDVVLILAKNKIRVEASFILGHHCDTRETIDKTLLLGAAVQQIGVIAYGYATPFPGTPLFLKLKKTRVPFSTSNWRQYNLTTPMFETEHFTKNDLRRALVLSERVDLLSGDMPLLSGGRFPELRAELGEWVAAAKQLGSGQGTYVRTI